MRVTHTTALPGRNLLIPNRNPNDDARHQSFGVRKLRSSRSAGASPGAGGWTTLRKVTMPSTPPSPAPEQIASLPNGMDLCYQTFGDPGAEPLLLVMGLGGPMTWWDPEFCQALADRGFFVIRYDNRDTGRSTRIRARVTRGQLVRAFGGRRTRARGPIRSWRKTAAWRAWSRERISTTLCRSCA